MRRVQFLVVLATILISCQPEAPKPEAQRVSEVVIAPSPPPPTWTPVEPTATPLLTPTPTLEWADVWATQGVDVTATKTVRRCLRYRPLLDRWNPDFNLDPALVFAVMAQESACYEDPPGGGASVGLMQVTPASWTTTAERLRLPAVNIYWGMRILWLTLNDEENNPEGDVRTALAAYNCGWVSLKAGKCFDFGGYAYADRVLDFWLPYVQEAMR